MERYCYEAAIATGADVDRCESINRGDLQRPGFVSVAQKLRHYPNLSRFRAEIVFQILQVPHLIILLLFKISKISIRVIKIIIQRF